MSNNTDKEENKVCLAVGGQALIEGVMMRGTNEIGIAVRKLDGEIVTKVDPINSKIKKYKIDKIPFIRGIFSFGSSLIIGTKALMFSAKLFDVEETEEEKAKAAKAKSNIDQLIAMLEQGGIDKDMVPELDTLINVLNKKKVGNE